MIASAAQLALALVVLVVVSPFESDWAAFGFLTLLAVCGLDLCREIARRFW